MNKYSTCLCTFCARTTYIYAHVCVYHNPVFLSHDLMSLIYFVFLQRHDISVSSNPETSLVLVLRVYEEPRMSLKARKNEK